MAGESFDYKFGNKNNWRRWQWNRIVGRLKLLGISPKEAVVLYLAGKDDHDRIVAKIHGFRDENMIAIEKDEKAFKDIKKRRVLGINHDLLNLLNAWPPTRKIDVVVADLCNGLNHRLLTGVGLMVTYPHLQSCVFAFNVLRGRDKETNDWRAEFSDLPLTRQKHRAIMLFSYYYECAFSFICGLSNLENGLLKPNGRTMEAAKIRDVSRILTLNCQPVFNSYLSNSRQKFDSAVWISPMWSAFKKRAELEERLTESYKSMGGVIELRRKIAATLAHRTMRKEGIGIYA